MAATFTLMADIMIERIRCHCCDEAKTSDRFTPAELRRRHGTAVCIECRRLGRPLDLAFLCSAREQRRERQKTEGTAIAIRTLSRWPSPVRVVRYE